MINVKGKFTGGRLIIADWSFFRNFLFEEFPHFLFEEFYQSLIFHTGGHLLMCYILLRVSSVFIHSFFRISFTYGFQNTFRNCDKFALV